jgi:alpha-tubulin suppressor-like RCC1 family protein
VAVPAQVTPRLVGELDFCAILAGQEWKSQIKQQVLQQQAPAADAHLAEESDPSASSSSDAPTDAVSSSQTSTSASAFQLAQVPRITTIECGPSYSAAISSSGHVYVWGSK